MRRPLAVFALLAALPALCWIAPLPARAATYPMAGAWFGTGQPDDRGEMYIDYFDAGGAFHNHHRWCRQGKIAADIKETGRWSVAGDILTIDIATVDGRPAPRRDRYRLTSVDGKSQNYVVLPTNFPYHARKVPASFAMPRCDLVG
jgi:hypothetical protein